MRSKDIREGQRRPRRLAAWTRRATPSSAGSRSASWVLSILGKVAPTRWSPLADPPYPSPRWSSSHSRPASQRKPSPTRTPSRAADPTRWLYAMPWGLSGSEL